MPTDRTHTDMTETRPTQPTIPARPDTHTLTLGTSLSQRNTDSSDVKQKHNYNNKRGNLH